MTRKYDLKSSCCNAPVLADATAAWDVETQSYELADTQDAHFCDECGYMCSVHMIDVETGIRLGRDPSGKLVPHSIAKVRHAERAEQVARDFIAAKRAAYEAEALSAALFGDYRP